MIVGLVGLIGSLAAAALLPPRLAQPTPLTFVVLFLAVLILDFFDLTLPQGDRIGLEGPILVAGLIVAPLVWVLGIGLAARAAARVLARRRGRLEDWVVDFGAGAVGTAAAGMVVSVATAEPPGQRVVGLLGVAVACSAFLVAQMAYSQLLSAIRLHRPFKALVRGNLRLQGPLLLAEVSTSVLLAMTYGQMGVWAVVLSVVLLLLLRHSYSLLIDVRATYMNTVEVLVETAESADPRRSGHSDRTAALAREIAEALGLTSAQVERLSYAALLHDLDMVGVDPEETGSAPTTSVGQTGRVLSEVTFLSEVVPVLEILDGDDRALRTATREHLLLAFVVAVASDLDSRQRGVPWVDDGDVVRVGRYLRPEDRSRVVAVTQRLGHRVPSVP